MDINDQVEISLKQATDLIYKIDFAVKTDAIRPVDFQEQMSQAVEVLSNLAVAIRRLNDQMRPLASFSALILAGEKLQAQAREAAIGESELEIATPKGKGRFVCIDDLPKGGRVR